MWAPTGALVVLALASPVAAAPSSWSPFDPVGDPEPPEVSDPEWRRNPVDRFVRARLDAEGLEPAPAVDRRAWLRRVTFDLTGLPPTPAEIDALLGDPRPDAEAFGDVADRLLASPRYGERWGRHWLDVVRYADSDGFAIDGERPTLWRYRDYIVRSFNEDRPFDRFIREQIAGDEIGAGDEAIVATGFLRLGPWEADNMVPRVKRQDYLNEITAATGVVFLGLTLGCARCHDHKYDPIPMRDFYGLQAFFTPLERSDRPAALQESEMTDTVRRLSREMEKELARRRGDLAVLRSGLRRKLARVVGKSPWEVEDEEIDRMLGKDGVFSSEEKERHKKLRAAVDSFEPAKKLRDVACAVKNPDAKKKAPETRILLGGSVASPGPEVEPRFLETAGDAGESLVSRLERLAEATSGRRAVLADWIASEGNPLTSRVLVNRVWHYHMGRGIVATVNDFGVNGSGASHPRLLDFLARRFLEGGWRLKPLHRLIVLSRAYRASTVHPRQAEYAELDSENALLWRGHHRRLEAETIRDAMLVVSGGLRLAAGGPGFFERIPRELGVSFPFFEWHPSEEAQRSRRSIWMFQRRNLVVPLLEAFDAADMSEPCGRRGRSVTALQALHLFNGRFAQDASVRFAERLLTEVPGAGEDPARVDRAFRLAFGRRPSDGELRSALRFLAEQLADRRSELEEERGRAGLVEARIGALADLCLVLFNADEFVYLE